MNCASSFSTFVCTSATVEKCTLPVVIPVISKATTCAPADLVLMSGTEYTTLKAGATTPTTGSTTVVDLPPFQIDPAGGAQIGAAILGVWAFAFAFRSLIRMLKESDFQASDVEANK